MSANTKNMSTNNSVLNNVNKFVVNFFDQLDFLDEQDVIKVTNAWKQNTEKFNELFVSLIKKSATRTKKPKDAPKNAKSAYMFYCQEMRAEVKEQNPELSAKEITAKLGAMWKEIKDNEEVEKYNELAAADKDRYKEEMTTYVPSEVENEQPEKKKRAKKPKDAPKNAKSAYMFFCADKRAEVKEQNPELTPKEITTKLGSMWKEIKDVEEEVEKYNELASADKDRYKEEMANYVPSEVSEGESDAEEKKDKKKRAKKPKDAPKNAKSAYMFFCQEMRASVKEENPELSAKDITTKLGAMWKEIKDDEEEVKKYNELAATDKDRYKEEMANYVPSEVSESDANESDADEKKDKKKRAKKPKDAPKNAKSAYMFFCQEMRASVKEGNPDFTPKEITAELGAMWKLVKDDEKEVKKYNELAAADKDRYKEEMANYVPNEDVEETEKKTEKTEKKAEKTEKKAEKSEKPVKKAVKKQSNQDIVREIIENCESESITMKLIKDELKKKGIELPKDELKAIISKINEDDE